MGGRGNGGARNSTIQASTESFNRALDISSTEVEKVLLNARPESTIAFVGDGLREVYRKQDTGHWTVDTYKGRTKVKDTEIVSSTSAASEIFKSNKKVMSIYFS